MTTGMGPTEPWPMDLKLDGNVKRPSGRPPVASRQSPRAITMTDRDTMKWWRPTLVTRSPMMAPIPTVATIAMTDASQGSTPRRKSQPAMTMASAVTEPTERSIPPEISRIVIPTTTIPSTAKAMAITRMFVQVMKYSEANVITITRTSRINMSPVSRIFMRRPA